MIKDTILRIEAAINRLEELDKANAQELTGLFKKLRAEVEKLPESQQEKTSSMINFAQAAVHESTREVVDEKLKELSIKGLGDSVKSFEATHPVLVDTVNDICLMLARIGI